MLLKLVLTPLLVAATTLVSRRWGPGIGGTIAGLPLTSGPVSVFLALEQGADFSARAALGTLLGLLSQAGFCLAYAWTARRAPWPVSTAAAVIAFAAVSVSMQARTWALRSVLALVCASLIASTVSMPAVAVAVRPFSPPPWELPVRMAAATLVVMALTAAAPFLGPGWTGLLSPFPVFAMILGGFTHRFDGAAAAARLLRGVVLGSMAHAVMFALIAAMLPAHGLVPTYGLASLAALATNALILLLLRRIL